SSSLALCKALVICLGRWTLVREFWVLFAIAVVMYIIGGVGDSIMSRRKALCTVSWVETHDIPTAYDVCRFQRNLFRSIHLGCHICVCMHISPLVLGGLRGWR